MNAVLDSTVVIGLSKGGCFDYLKVTLSRIYLTSEIVNEIVVEGKDRPGDKELSSALHSWIHVEEPQKELIDISST
jgi:hypothetical protein